MNNKVVVLASGGLDSSVVLAHYKYLGYEVFPMYINYGNVNLAEEINKLNKVLNKLGISNMVQSTYINLGWSKSLINNASDTEDGLYVNMRNLVFISLATSYAESIGANKVAVGFIDVPCPYHDASPQFLEDMNIATAQSCGIYVEAPLINLNKQGVYELGVRYGLSLDDTISCNTPIDGQPCGVCDDCKDIQELVIE